MMDLNFILNKRLNMFMMNPNYSMTHMNYYLEIVKKAGKQINLLILTKILHTLFFAEISFKFLKI